MAQIFVSHSSADNELAAKVKDSLADLGYESVFLDFDPTGGLVPGQAWRDQLFTNLDALRRGRLHHHAEVERQPVVPLRAGADPLAAQAGAGAPRRRLRAAPLHRGPAGPPRHVERDRPRSGPGGAHRARARPGGALGPGPVAVPGAGRIRESNAAAFFGRDARSSSSASWSTRGAAAAREQSCPWSDRRGAGSRRWSGPGWCPRCGGRRTGWSPPADTLRMAPAAGRSPWPSPRSSAAPTSSRTDGRSCSPGPAGSPSTCRSCGRPGRLGGDQAWSSWSTRSRSWSP